MTRLTDLPADQAKRLAELECPDFTTRPWVTGPELSERRVAIVPDSVKRLAAKKIDVSVQSGAGASSFASDAEYLGAGARVDSSAEALLSDAAAVVQIHPPRVDEVARLAEGTVLVSL